VPEPAPVAEPPDDDWANRTSVEALPLGERVHQEEVAGSLFDSSEPPVPGKTGSFSIDSLEWGYARTPKSEAGQNPKTAAILRAMQATAAKPATPAEPAVEPPRQAKALDGDAAPVKHPPRPKQSRLRENAIVLLVLLGGGVVMAAAGVIVAHLLR
jgi:hypothetical protein